MADEILTLTDVARLLKVADKTVYRFAQRGELPGFKVGGQWRFRRQDLEAWIEQRRVGGQTLSSAAPTRSTPRVATGEHQRVGEA